MPDMRSVFSSHVANIGHDADTNELHVQWKNGKTSIYEGVDENKANLVMNSESIGQALNQFVKNQHEHRYG